MFDLPFTDLKKNTTYDLVKELRWFLDHISQDAWSCDSDDVQLMIEITEELQRRYPHAAEKI